MFKVFSMTYLTYLFIQSTTKTLILIFLENIEICVPIFLKFCPNFRQIKSFGGALASPAPSPLLEDFHASADTSVKN